MGELFGMDAWIWGTVIITWLFWGLSLLFEGRNKLKNGGDGGMSLEQEPLDNEELEDSNDGESYECDECGEEFKDSDVVEFEEAGAMICKNCINKAYPREKEVRVVEKPVYDNNVGETEIEETKEDTDLESDTEFD